MALAFDLANPVTGTAWVAPGSGAVGSRAAVLTEFEQRRLLRIYRSLALLAAVPHEFAPQVGVAVDLDATQGRHDWPPSALAIAVRARQGQRSLSARCWWRCRPMAPPVCGIAARPRFGEHKDPWGACQGLRMKGAG